MDYFFPNHSTINISNARIDNIDRERNTTFVTVSYTDQQRRPRATQTVRLVVGNNTRILDERGNQISARQLEKGMIVNDVISSAMTRSIPPQATAFMIRIVRRQKQDNITVGRILDINRQNQSFTTISDRDFSSVIRFNVSSDTMILDRSGRRIYFSRLLRGMQVRVRHAAFMTASIPPQTTAFEIRIL